MGRRFVEQNQNSKILEVTDDKLKIKLDSYWKTIEIGSTNIKKLNHEYKKHCPKLFISHPLKYEQYLRLGINLYIRDNIRKLLDDVVAKEGKNDPITIEQEKLKSYLTIKRPNHKMQIKCKEGAILNEISLFYYLNFASMKGEISFKHCGKGKILIPLKKDKI